MFSRLRKRKRIVKHEKRDTCMFTNLEKEKEFQIMESVIDACF